MPLSIPQSVAAPGHSTGPRTPEGKAAFRPNTRKHGCSSSMLSPADEDTEEFENWKITWIAEYAALNSPASIPLAIHTAEA